MMPPTLLTGSKVSKSSNNSGFGCEYSVSRCNNPISYRPVSYCRSSRRFIAESECRFGKLKMFACVSTSSRDDVSIVHDEYQNYF